MVGIAGVGPTVLDYIDAVYKNFPLTLGLIALVTFVLLVRTFDARISPALDRIALAATARAAVDRQLPKLAGAELDGSINAEQRAEVRHAIDDSFVSAFRFAMLGTAALAFASAVAGYGIRRKRAA